MKDRVITVFGGSGFVGQYVVKYLAKQGALINVASRRPERADFLRTAGQVGQITLTYTNITNEEVLRTIIANSDVVINLVGILFEKNYQKFSTIHAQSAERIAKLCNEYHIERLIHMSALGVDENGHSLYARTKHNGEKAVLNAYPDATIIRPSIIFGTEDNFFNQFARIASFSPFLPLIGGGHTKFQPVYVGDVAQAIIAILNQDDSKGLIYELGGPEIYSFRELLQHMLSITHQRALFLPLPTPLASFLATFLELLPTPPITRDQVKLLEHDNVVNPIKPGMSHFEDLAIHPTMLESITPSYLHRYAHEYVREM